MLILPPPSPVPRPYDALLSEDSFPTAPPRPEPQSAQARIPTPMLPPALQRLAAWVRR